jgi:hypothetical protein
LILQIDGYVIQISEVQSNEYSTTTSPKDLNDSRPLKTKMALQTLRPVTPDRLRFVRLDREHITAVADTVPVDSEFVDDCQQQI